MPRPKDIPAPAAEAPPPDKPPAGPARSKWRQAFAAAMVVAAFAALATALGRGWFAPSPGAADAMAWTDAGNQVEALPWSPAMRPSGLDDLPGDAPVGLAFGGSGPNAPAARMEMASGTPEEAAAAYRKQAEEEGWTWREDWSGRMSHGPATHGRTLAFQRDGRLRVILVGESSPSGGLPVLVFDSTLSGRNAGE